MTYQITTSYPDGRTETRDATPEEVAQREADIAAAEEQRLAEEAAYLEHQTNLLGGLDKLINLGLTEPEAAAVSNIHDVAALRSFMANR